jgi:hypothetical protein
MPKTRPYLVTLLAGVCCLTLSECDPSAGPARGNDPSGRGSEIAAIREHGFRRVQTEAEFQAVLRADRAALFFFGGWSQDSVNSRRLVEAWVRECRPAFGVFLVDPDEQPFARQWLVEQWRDDAFHHYQRQGAVIWLCRGEIAAEEIWPHSHQDLQLGSEQAFGHHP